MSITRRVTLNTADVLRPALTLVQTGDWYQSTLSGRSYIGGEFSGTGLPKE